MSSPEKRFKVGNCTASVFVRTVEGKNGPVKLRSATVQKVYKAADGTFQFTGSFDLNDMPKAILALQKAYEHALMEKSD